ncbi:MAG: LacI family DNA-binding transcriptional regulator [Acidimicrobiales bacterium]
MTSTIRDVANEAGVSVATVSRALSGRRQVSGENLRRVHAAAAALGYRPNLLASAMRSQVTNTIGLVIPQIGNPFFPALIGAIEWQLQTTTRQLLLCDSHGDVDVERHRLQVLLDRQVDGIMISPCDAQKSGEAVRSAALQVPLVQVDRSIRARATDWVGVDDSVGLQLLVEHLARAGARSIAFVSSLPTNSSARARLNAFVSEAANLSMRPLKPLLGDFTVSWGVAAATDLLERRELPDAVVCGNDLIALGVLRQFHLSGVLVPKDVLVTGFDDIALAELSTPSLTTIRQPHNAIAGEALRLLADRFERPDAPCQRISMVPELVERESTTRSAAAPRLRQDGTHPRRPTRGSKRK